MRLLAGTFPVLAINAPYNESWFHAIPPGRIAPAEGDASVLLCVTLSALALLPASDESAMNLEGVGILSSKIPLVSETFLRIGSELRRECSFPFSGQLRSRIGVILRAWP